LLAGPPWSEVAERSRALIVAAIGPEGRERELAAVDPIRPSEAVEAARGAAPEELALARAMGAGWLDDYVTEWRSMTLEIGGDDLIAAGVPEGPAVGRGLRAALTKKLDGEISGRDQELEAAVDAARQSEAKPERPGTRDERREGNDGMA
jgi:tRNA nucleotidyltransferase (CCA-adding enzyme)